LKFSELQLLRTLQLSSEFEDFVYFVWISPALSCFRK